MNLTAGQWRDDERVADTMEHSAAIAAQGESGLSRVVPFIAAVVCGAAMAIAVLLAPGRAGAALVQAVAALAFAVFAVAGFRRLGSDSLGSSRDAGSSVAAGAGVVGDGTTAENPSVAEDGGIGDPAISSSSDGDSGATPLALGPEQRNMLRIGIIAAIAIEAVVVLAIGALHGEEIFDAPAMFVLGIAGFLAATAAYVAWMHAFLREFARWNNRIQEQADASGHVEPDDRAADAGGDRKGSATFTLISAFCFAVIAIGLALCFNITQTPLVDRSSWAVLCGCVVCAVLVACAWFLFRTPRMARQIGSLHDRYESTVSELGEAQEKVSALESDMASLRARHDDAMRKKRLLESQVSTLRIKKDEQLRPAAVEACMAIAEEFGLSNRERDVLVLLSRGYSRKRAADELFVEASTISSHVNRLYRKLNVHSSQELIDFVESRR